MSSQATCSCQQPRQRGDLRWHAAPWFQAQTCGAQQGGGEQPRERANAWAREAWPQQTRTRGEQPHESRRSRVGLEGGWQEAAAPQTRWERACSGCCTDAVWFDAGQHGGCAWTQPQQQLCPQHCTGGCTASEDGGPWCVTVLVRLARCGGQHNTLCGGCCRAGRGAWAHRTRRSRRGGGASQDDERAHLQPACKRQGGPGRSEGGSGEGTACTSGSSRRGRTAPAGACCCQACRTPTSQTGGHDARDEVQGASSLGTHRETHLPCEARPHTVAERPRWS